VLLCHGLQVLKRDVGIGGVVSLLWFQRCLPPYVCKFFEMCLMVTADHGPAVSGAHNTIVCARAGKDLVSSLVSGLLTVVSMSVLAQLIGSMKQKFKLCVTCSREQVNSCKQYLKFEVRCAIT
jgi:hypothetical protein